MSQSLPFLSFLFHSTPFLSIPLQYKTHRAGLRVKQGNDFRKLKIVKVSLKVFKNNERRNKKATRKQNRVWLPGTQPFFNHFEPALNLFAILHAGGWFQKLK
ncbi:MAG TPA: hypothetical protein ENH39_08665 [Gammaproteobacteria bacterium]|nr:hypothetical protein [Gammaproteobacteria bacterium]